MNDKNPVEALKQLGSRLKAVGVPWFRREDYPVLRDLFVDRDNIFDTYEEWLAAAERKELELKTTGAKIVRIIVEPGAFATWCREQGLETNGQARAMYAGAKAAEIGTSPQNPLN